MVNVIKQMISKDKLIPQGYKDSPLGIIPEEWEVKRLGDVCKISVGRDVQIDHFKEKKTDKFRYPVYSNTVEEKGLYGYYDYEEYCSGAVTVVGRGVGLGTSFARDKGFGAIGRLVVLHPHNCLRNHFLENYINNEVKFFVESAAIPQLTGEQIATYKILIPPLSQQEKMENYINLWDTAIEKQSELIEKLTLRKRALMQQLLTGKKRLAKFSGEWERIKFKEIFQRKAQTVNDSSSVQVLSVTKEGIISQKEYFNKDIASDDTSKYLLVEKGDLAMSGLNFWMGSCHILTQYEKGIISPAYKVFSVRDGFSIEYILYFVQSHNFKSSLLGSSVIGASIVRRNLDLEMLEEWTYSLPSLPEQQAISSILIYADKEIEIQKQKLTAMQEQKKGLMQVLLTGKKRI